MPPSKSRRRTRVERGVYRQPNGNYAVCARHAGRLHFRTCGRDLETARRAREELVTALAAGRTAHKPKRNLMKLMAGLEPAKSMS